MTAKTVVLNPRKPAERRSVAPETVSACCDLIDSVVAELGDDLNATRTALGLLADMSIMLRAATRDA